MADSLQQLAEAIFKKHTEGAHLSIKEVDGYAEVRVNGDIPTIANMMASAACQNTTIAALIMVVNHIVQNEKEVQFNRDEANAIAEGMIAAYDPKK